MHSCDQNSLHVQFIALETRRGAWFFGGGARFDLAAPRSLPLVSCTQILLSRFHPGRGGAKVLNVGENVNLHLLYTGGTRNITLHGFHYCDYDV